jgi:hypothetical protein
MSAPPPPSAAPGPPGGNSNNNGQRSYGPPRNGRTFGGWLRSHPEYRERAEQLAKDWKKPWKFLEWSDGDIVYLYAILTAQNGQPAANGYHAQNGAY